ncbi:hypothetical protein [Peribacillus frigoritolerans]|nr:hypothetical protein [Peribacillus frigoritolerans]
MMFVKKEAVHAHCAYFLTETGLIFFLIDKRDASEGSTVANTGLLQFSNE